MPEVQGAGMQINIVSNEAKHRYILSERNKRKKKSPGKTGSLPHK